MAPLLIGRLLFQIPGCLFLILSLHICKLLAVYSIINSINGGGNYLLQGHLGQLFIYLHINLFFDKGGQHFIFLLAEKLKFWSFFI